MGMNRKCCACMVFVFLLAIIPLVTFVSAADASIIVYMPEQSPQTDDFDNPMLVAGIWHFVDITLDETTSEPLTVRMFAGATAPSFAQRNASNYYEWSYSEASEPAWQDIMTYGGRNYIDEGNCSHSGALYRFCIGVKDTFPSISSYQENWTLEASTNQDTLYLGVIAIQKPTTALRASHIGTISFRVDPFTEMTDEGSDYFTIENTGNLPLDVSINYGAYTDYLDFENLPSTLAVGDSADIRITLNSASWKPGIRDGISGEIEGVPPSSYIIYADQLTFPPALYPSTSNLKINVGHANHKIVDDLKGGLVFQYEESLTMSEGEIREIHAYLFGDGQAILDVWSDEKNVTIKEIRSEDGIETSPISIVSTDTAEHTITIKAEALRENQVGKIYYKLDIDGEIREFETTITIEPPHFSGNEATPLPFTTIILLFFIVLIVAYMVISYLRHRR